MTTTTTMSGGLTSLTRNARCCARATRPASVSLLGASTWFAPRTGTNAISAGFALDLIPLASAMALDLELPEDVAVDVAVSAVVGVVVAKVAGRRGKRDCLRTVQSTTGSRQ